MLRHLLHQHAALPGNAPVGSYAQAERADVLPQGQGMLDAQLMSPMHPGLLGEALQSLGRDPVDLRLMLLHPRHSHAICSQHCVCAALRCLHCRSSRPRVSTNTMLQIQYHRPCPLRLRQAAYVPSGGKRWTGQDGSPGGGGGGLKRQAPVCLR